MTKYILPAICCCLMFSAISTLPASAKTVATERSSQKPDRTPTQVLKAFYIWYLYAMDEEIDVFTTRRTTLHKYLTSRLIRNIDKDEVESAGADVFTQSSVFSQGWVHKIVVRGVRIHGASATAMVQFGKSDDPIIALTLIKQGGTWKIDKVKDGKPTAKPVKTD